MLEIFEGTREGVPRDLTGYHVVLVPKEIWTADGICVATDFMAEYSAEIVNALNAQPSPSLLAKAREAARQAYNDAKWSSKKGTPAFKLGLDAYESVLREGG